MTLLIVVYTSESARLIMALKRNSEKVGMIGHFRPYFFNTWFKFFFQNIKVGGGEKIKIKITKFFFYLI